MSLQRRVKDLEDRRLRSLLDDYQAALSAWLDIAEATLTAEEFNMMARSIVARLTEASHGVTVTPTADMVDMAPKVGDVADAEELAAEMKRLEREIVHYAHSS